MRWTLTDEPQPASGCRSPPHAPASCPRRVGSGTQPASRGCQSAPRPRCLPPLTRGRPAQTLGPGPARGLPALAQTGSARGRTASGPVIVFVRPGVWSIWVSEETYLAADEPADKLLGRPDGLVPRAGGPVGVVLGDAARGHGRSGQLGSCVRGVVLGVGLLLLDTAFGLLLQVVSDVFHEAVCQADWTWMGLTSSPVLPVILPTAFWTAPVAESMYDLRVDGLVLSDMIAVERVFKIQVFLFGFELS